MNTLVALLADDGVVEQLAMFTDYGAFVRSDGDWLPVSEDTDPDDDLIDGLEPVDADESFIALFDSAQETSATLMKNDVVEEQH